MSALVDFIMMDGYGGYIWSCYAVTLLVFVGLWVFASRNKIRALRRISQSQHKGRQNYD